MGSLLVEDGNDTVGVSQVSSVRLTFEVRLRGRPHFLNLTWACGVRVGLAATSAVSRTQTPILATAASVGRMSLPWRYLPVFD
jgi:hypothetical protein